MKFLVDNQLPRALALFLASHGHSAQHVIDLGFDEAADVELWRHARENDMILVSKDEDFFHLANRVGDEGKLVWVRIGNCRRQVLIEAFDHALPQIASAFAEGYCIVEVR